MPKLTSQCVLGACLAGLAMTIKASDAPANSPTNALGQLEAFSGTTQALQATFEQVTRDRDGYVIDRATGVFSFNAPNQFRWAYAEPFEEVIVGDGSLLWHYDPNLEQVTVREQPKAADSPVLVLTNFKLMQESYDIALGDDDNRVELTPQTARADIAMAWVVFTDGQPRVVGWEDRFSQTTRIEFQGLETNIDLDGGLFEFSPPAGVDVLEGL